VTGSPMFCVFACICLVVNVDKVTQC
jgi:hypothetical protein